MTESWRLLDYDVGPSRTHFAHSDALARYADVPTMWWHSTTRPTVILGTGQPWSQLDHKACREAGVELVRRQAGGTAVLAAAGVLGLDVALPTTHYLAGRDVVEAYRWLGEAWVRTCARLGIRSRLVTIEEARRDTRQRRQSVDPLSAVCFGTLSPYEVVSQGRKLVGLAQVRRKRAILLQCAVHRHFDAAGLVTLLIGHPESSLTARLSSLAVGLDEVSDPVPKDHQIAFTFKSAVEGMLNVQVISGQWTELETCHAAEVQSTMCPPLNLA